MPATPDPLRTVPDRTRRGMAAYLVVMAAAVGSVAAIGVFGRGDGATEAVVSPRGEPFDMVTTGIYAFNPDRLVAEGIGWDLVTLVLVVPALLLVARGVRRGSVRARLLAVGLLAYLFYQYLMYAMAWAIGPLLLPFVAIYGASLLGIAWFLTTIPTAELGARIDDGFPHRGMAVFSGVMALLLTGMWVPMIVEVLTGGLEGNLIGQTTLVVQALDLGLVVPVAATTAVLAWRRHPLGTLLAATLVVKGLTMAVAITAMVLSAWYVEGELGVGDLLIFVAAAAVCVELMRRMYGAIDDGAIDEAGAVPGVASGPGGVGGRARGRRSAT